MLLTFNLYIWKIILPKIKQEFFQNKFFSISTLFYISIFSLPRKFLFHFFFGNGFALNVDTKKVILENPLVYQKLNSELNNNLGNGSKGVFHITQTDLFNPQYRYSIGSFDIEYLIQNEKVFFNVISNYSYGQNNNRLTMHLHNWLNGFTKNGRANDFRIIGTAWSINLLEFRQKNIQFEKSFLKKGGPTLGKLLL